MSRRPVEEHKEEDVVKPTFTALVIAYAERIECFMQYLKKQPEGNSLGINKKEDPAQEHYSIVMDVILDGTIEKIKIIYIKYQDDRAFGGFTAGDAKYAFIGGDLYDKQDVRDFLVNCGVPQEHRFVTPCAYNIDAAGASGETDCQKRKFKKSIFKRLSNAMFKSDEKTPIAADKNKFDYNVDFFNEIVRNNETKQCIARPFIMLQFPLFICWSYEYYAGGAQNIETTKQKLINMFKASSSVSNSLLESLRIPAKHMFENKPDDVAAPVDENMAKVPSVARNNFDLGSITVPVVTSKQYKIDNATNESFKLVITEGEDETEKTFTKGRCYKNVGPIEDTNEYCLSGTFPTSSKSNLFATFLILRSHENMKIESLFLADNDSFISVDESNPVNPNPNLITNKLLGNLKQITYKIDPIQDGFNLTITRPGPESNEGITHKEFKINKKYKKRKNIIYELVNAGQNPEFKMTDDSQRHVGDIRLSIEDDSHLKVIFIAQRDYVGAGIMSHATEIEMLNEIPELAVAPAVDKSDESNTQQPPNKKYVIVKTPGGISFSFQKGEETVIKQFNEGTTYVNNSNTNDKNKYVLDDEILRSGDTSQIAFKITAPEGTIFENDVNLTFGRNIEPIIKDETKSGITFETIEGLVEETPDPTVVPTVVPTVIPTVIPNVDPNASVAQPVNLNPESTSLYKIINVTTDRFTIQPNNIALTLNPNTTNISRLEWALANPNASKTFENNKEYTAAGSSEQRVYKLTSIENDASNQSNWKIVFILTEPEQNNEPQYVINVSNEVPTMLNKGTDFFLQLLIQSLNEKTIEKNIAQQVKSALSKLPTNGVFDTKSLQAQEPPQKYNDDLFNALVKRGENEVKQSIDEYADFCNETFSGQQNIDTLWQLVTLNKLAIGDNYGLSIARALDEDPSLSKQSKYSSIKINKDFVVEIVNGIMPEFTLKRKGDLLLDCAYNFKSGVDYTFNKNITFKLKSVDKDNIVFEFDGERPYTINLSSEGEQYSLLNYNFILLLKLVDPSKNPIKSVCKPKPQGSPEEAPQENYIVLYDFIAQHEKELTVKAGDIVHSTEKPIMERILVRNDYGNEGYVPLNYLQKFEDVVPALEVTAKRIPSFKRNKSIKFNFCDWKTYLIGFDSPLNNNCYLNVFFQMLSNMPDLKKVVLEGLTNQTITLTNPDLTARENSLFQIASILKMHEEIATKIGNDETKTVYLDDLTETNIANYRNQTIYGGIKTAAFGEQEISRREVRNKDGSKTFQEIKRSTLGDLQFDIEPLLRKNVFCKDSDQRDKTNYILGNVMFEFKDPQTDEQSYYGRLSLDQGVFGANTSVHNILNSPDNSCMAQIKTQLVAPDTNKKHLILFFDRMNNPMNRNAEVYAEPILIIDGAVFANKGAIIRQGDIAGHFVFVAFKCPTEESKGIGNVVDKIYDNANILSFDGDNSGLVHFSQEGFEKKLELFLHRINDIGVNPDIVQSVVNTFLDNPMLLCGVKTEDIDNQFATLRVFLNGQKPLPENEIIGMFSKPIFHDYINLSQKDLNGKIAQNATFFLYERVDDESGQNKPMAIFKLKSNCDKLYLSSDETKLNNARELFLQALKEFQIKLDSENKLTIMNSIPGWWCEGGDNNKPSKLYNFLVRRGLIEQNDENERKYYDMINDILTKPATVGGASKKKSWSRSRRAKKHTNVSLKRLNKMKRESHPSIKKRTTSLKK